jgi:two-component system, response regulator / RNA-binding antiterminator
LKKDKVSSYAAPQYRDIELRIAVVDESAARAAVIEEGLRDAGLTDVTMFADRHGIAARLEALSPDVVLINLANPHRDELEELFSRPVPKN